MREVRCPALVIHGERDDLIPCWHGRALYRLAPEPKSAYWASRAGHNDVRYSDEGEYWRQIEAFVARVDPLNH